LRSTYIRGTPFAATLLSTIVAVLGASAHPSADWYGHQWTADVEGGINTDKTVDWRFVNNFPTGNNQRNRVNDAAGVWNSLAGSMTFHHQDSQPDYSGLGWGDPCPSNPVQSDYQVDKIGWQDIGSTGWHSSEPLGQEYHCVINGTAILFFRVRLNKDAPWGWDANNPPASGRWDGQGLAEHELGHAGGRDKGGDGYGHFTQSSNECPGASNLTDRHTMCPTEFDGSNYARSLETHDRDTFNNTY
jgi:hypothetical protein